MRLKDTVIQYLIQYFFLFYPISPNGLTQILGKHKAYFPLTSSLSEFENNNLFQKIGNSYFFKTTQNEINYWYDLNDEISGHYWEALMQDNSFSNDEERMLHFIDVILKGARWPDIQDYASDASKKSLLTTSINLIEREQDIIGVEDEFSKCFLDQHLGSSHYGFQSNKPIPEEPFDDTDDILDRYRQLQHISSKYQSNIFYVQESRKDLAFLVRLVVLLDKEYDTVDIDSKSEQVHYHNIKKLLRSGLENPYLIWEVVHFIKQNRPEVIPYLLIETDLSALGFDMLDKTKFEIDNRKAKHILRKQFLSDGLILLLNSYLRAQAIDKTKTAHLVFQLFQKITKEKVYSISHIRLVEERRLLITEREDLEEQLLGILETSNLNGGFVGGSSKQSFLYHIFPELILELENHRSKSKYLNGVIGLSFIKLDALCWLSRFLLIADCTLPQKTFVSFKTTISLSFVTCYLEKIEQNKVIKREFYSSELIESLPSWSVQNEVLVTLDWLSPITIAYESGNLNDFLNPRFTLKNTDDKYDKHNCFQANKIRTHLFILLLILKAIQKQKNYSKQAFTLDVKKTVELTIVSLLKRYAQEGLAHNQNILDQEYDRQHFRTIESELLPFIIEMGDVFEDKSALFDQLVNTENIVQLLYICSHSETEGIKESVIKRIYKLDIPSFLNKQIWRPEITYVVTELSKIPELQSKAKIALNEWNKLTSKRKIERETEKEIFEAQLMQAYYANDEYGIQSLKEPESGYIIHNEFKPKDHKQFFIGLIRYKNEPETAYQIFNNLTNKYPKYATFALNRFGAKVELALKNEKREQFLEGINEWLEYEKTCPLTVLETVADKTNYNKLTVFLNLEDKDSFNMLYEELDQVRRLSPDMVKLRVQMLVKYELINEARMVVANALSFHKALNQNAFEFLTELESKISKSNPVEEIKTAINKLSTDTKNSMDSVIPLQYEDNFGKKMANEIIIASRRFLTNPKAYNPNADEDDYSSIIKQILENKLSTFGFHINDQP